MRSRWLGGLAACALAAALAGAVAPPAALAQQFDIGAAQKRFQDLYATGDFAAALAEAQRTEAAAKRGGTNSLAYVLAANDLGRAYQALGNYTNAANLFSQSLGILQKNVPASDPRVGQIQANLATVYLLQGRAADAEKLYKQALETASKSYGPASAQVATLTGNLADVAKQQARYDEAERLYKQALDLAERASGPDSLQVALILNNLTKVYEEQSRFDEVQDASKRALAIRERALGPDHPEVAASLNNLAHVYERLGRYAQADELFQRAIMIWEKRLGPKHPHLATALLNLASVYADEDRLDEAEALYKRALGIREGIFGPNHLEVAVLLNNLAQIYESQGRYGDVESYSKRALAIVEKALGPNNPDTAKVIRKLGVAYDGLGRRKEAEAQFKRALDIYTKAFGPNHRYLATVLINEGHLFESEGRWNDAERAYQRALTINRSTRGENHPEVARVLNDLAALSMARGDPRASVDYARQASAAVLAHATIGDVGGQQLRESGGLIEQRGAYFANHVASLWAASRAGIEPSAKLGGEAFEIAQWASQSSTAAAVQQLSPRFGASNDRLAALVRQNQDLRSFWRDRDKALVQALSRSEGASAAQVDAIRKQMADTERKLADTSAQLRREFPEFSELANPKPLTVEEAQRRLGADEALVFLLAGEKESYVFVLKRDAFDWHAIAAGRDDLVLRIASFRKGLDLDTMQQFDLEVAYGLYSLLLGPVDGVIKSASHLMIVPSGPLTAVPFHLLVTEKPAVSAPQSRDKPTVESTAPFRNAGWLIKRQAISILPAVSSLQTLRSLASRESGSKPMVGFGDPVFNPARAQQPGEQRRTGRSSRGKARSYADYWRGAGLDRSMLAQALPQLPDTADELKAVAGALGAPASDLHLGRDASVTTVKHVPLADYRIVYFATHGLVAGDVKGLGEPALAMTIPVKPTAEDDGLLKASEVAQLKLNADWVVLSACNTVAGDKPGAEALSGLARSFFYAGARSLLVSHWAVASDAATRLTTQAFDILKADPKLGRAEAMRRTMLSYLADTSNPENAYPALWGPFAVIGEGGAR
ncbi:MAG: tetratricopeptide repeat protein [Hyphomicrobiales bacterium]|nr:tetratricopeptide repeat protein [Hyphomicrobiales bacterium]